MRRKTRTSVGSFFTFKVITTTDGTYVWLTTGALAGRGEMNGQAVRLTPAMARKVADDLVVIAATADKEGR